jgi:aminoglycoside phosphotransferase (APT) family kinase protein
MTESSSPPGIPSPARLAGWLNDHVPGGPVELTDIQLIAGGRSNLTYRLTVSGRETGPGPGPAPGPGAGPGPEHGSRANGTRQLVLRRPPLGHVLPTAHDMSREYRVLSALAGTEVPVAPLVAACTDDEVIGAPFYLMEYVPGVVLRTRDDTKDLTEEQAAGLSRCLADMMATIHGVDVGAVGLGDLGRGAGYLRRQLDRWQRQWDLSTTRDMPGYKELVQRLTARLPEDGQTTLVHGDYRLDNALVTLDPEPRITAVVDWEMATLGDPLADVGLMKVYWDVSRDLPGNPVAGAVSAAAGFPAMDDLLDRYAARTGLDLAPLPWYTAFAGYKLAVIAEGIHFRYTQGKTVGEGFSHVGDMVAPLVTSALETLLKLEAD